MDLPEGLADVLAQPTRARLFQLLTELRRPAGTDELAGRLSLHPNGVRTHLERLREAGLIAREREQPAIGRPRDMWQIDPNARPTRSAPSGYADLGRWLAKLVSPSATSLRAVEETGREIGRELAPDEPCGPGGAEQTLHAGLVSLGFQPQRERREDGGLTYKLRNCPYRDVVRENQPVICTLHRGLTRGLLDELSPTTNLEGFIPHDPDEAGCLIELRGPLADEYIDDKI